MAISKDWWRGAVMYQIYPRSFKDTNGDGVGDLKGITEKLEYVAGLGVDGIWISPFKKSPMKDFGYDVSDYCDIDPLFGTMDDFRALLKKAHSLNLKILVDMIFSHTSNEHPWFQESHKSRDNPKADWYVWADPKEDGNPPNNWVSVFGGSAWQYDSWRGQYYLHNFLTEQPDLNFHNPDVQKAILDVAKFWLDLGVDGLRLDVINFCFHDKELRDNPAKSKEDNPLATQLTFPDPYSMQKHVYDKSRPENLEFIKKLRALTNQYPGVMTLGEIGDDHPVERAIEYVSGSDKLNTCYGFALVTAKAKSASAIRTAIEEFESKGKDIAWPSWAFSNHDTIRAVSRWAGDYDQDPRIAKMLIALLTSLRGTAFVYQGEELGLPETKLAFEDIKDPWGKYLYPKWQGRDGCRTPMPWGSVGLNFGFGEGQPWLPMNKDHGSLAADVQTADPQSTLSFVKVFLKWRKGQEALVMGDIVFFETGTDEVLGFRRSLEGQTFVCLFNFADASRTISSSEVGKNEPSFLWDGLTGDVRDGQVTLPPFGFVIS
ncbi:MAG: alpha-glucosidase [Micavibrio aeruginosavorus]|uniref:Alpha-glucosidase n=1 Tax=Micavibrio aeruginosavorus TaxID=349221 RepID=A0A2W5MXW2_9BACT|nr:MAG: alpha-glucosidase [Micavibrio aeruginosavorus]